MKSENNGEKITRAIGLDLGKMTFSAVWLEKQDNPAQNWQGSPNNIGRQWKIKKTFWKAHQQEIKKIWEELKIEWQIGEKDQIVTTGRLRQMLPFPSVVEKIAQEEAVRFLYPNQDLTLIRLGGGGFSVLKVRNSGPNEFSQNPRCAAGVGSFLDQIMARVGLSVLEADKLVGEAKGIEITSRCGVTMKTDFTHLLNSGYQLEEVVAGLLDSSAKNAATLALKSEVSSRVLIIGGLSILKRIISTIEKKLPEKTKVEVPSESLYFEALGAALIGKKEVKSKDKKDIFGPNLNSSELADSDLVFLPSLSDYLVSVNKVKTAKQETSLSFDSPIVGLDIGSTGSKIVLFDQEPIFEAYTPTEGQPVEAAKNLIRKIPQNLLEQVKAVGCTGSGREIVANLLKASLPEKDRDRIFVLNEIAAHAKGAHYYDENVDTVVDIGGQDAKFTRLESGRVIDSCMNTVCSAGTGSFLAEQVELLGIKNIEELGRIALESPRAVDLGQHCAVFISEQIDEAKRKGANLPEIIAGLYYSVVQNYNNRVKGLRDYGKKIFLQGKPAENIALACALAKVTGNPIVVPPSPGTPGALGIALLAKEELNGNLSQKASLDLDLFLNSKILEKREFRCQSKEGCLIGNLCPIQNIKVEVGQEIKQFFWGGSCDKYEKNSDKNLALAKAPRSFIERENLILGLLKEEENSDRAVAIPRGLETEEILPLSITFFQELGFSVKMQKQPSLKSLEEGGKLCQTTFCAPLQLLAGQAKSFENENFIFLPKIIEISGLVDNPGKNRSFACPLSQAMPDLFSPRLSAKVLQSLLNFKKGAESNKIAFLKMGFDLGCSEKETISAFEKAVRVQKEFEDKCREIGEKALRYAKENKVPIVVVLGHPYIINSSLMSAGIPEAIQENGAIALSASCYPRDKKSTLFKDIYWGYGQRLLQSAWQIRRQPGVYPLWLSVYSCGPDSFLIHFFQYLAKGKPYTILESDAYAGQAGFKTRVESFLYGIKNYREKDEKIPLDFWHFGKNESISEIKKNRHKVLVPWMGESTIVLSAFFKSLGIKSEYLPLEKQDSLEFGRKFTSGKECLPMIITLGSLFKYLESHEESFYYFMPQASGPCRLGQYQLLFKIILEKLGLDKRIKILSPSSETGYQSELGASSAAMAKASAAVVFVDLLKDALYDIRPEEKIPGTAQKIFDLYLRKAEELISKQNNNWLGLKDLWGLVPLAKTAVWHFQQVPRDEKKQGKPIVLVTGEIYLRLNSFANNEVIKKLEKLGVKVKLSPLREWANYVTYLRRNRETLSKTSRPKMFLTSLVQERIEKRLYQIFAKELGWKKDHHMKEILETARPYLKELKPLGEAALTIGLPLLLWQKKEIAGVAVVGPFECMPNRISETQLSLITQKTGLPVLNLSFYGESLDGDMLESFVWDLEK